MKKLFIGLVVIVAISCKKNALIDQPSSATPANGTTATALQTKNIEACDFGLKPGQFNLVKRAPIDNEVIKRNIPMSRTSDITPGGAVIFLDFDGYTLHNTPWNYDGDIVCKNSGLNADQMLTIYNKVADAYSPWNVTVTTDESVYDAASVGKRTRVLITESYEWYGSGSGGVAFGNSFNSGEETPCFIFSSLLGYNTKYIMEAAAHEAGHTLGLKHQANVKPNCQLISQYNYGNAQFAPIMGVAYYSATSGWIVGKTSVTYTICETQNDMARIDMSLTRR